MWPFLHHAHSRRDARCLGGGPLSSANLPPPPTSLPPLWHWSPPVPTPSATPPQRFNAHTGSYVEQQVVRANNAYLVVYDRVPPPPDRHGPSDRGSASASAGPSAAGSSVATPLAGAGSSAAAYAFLPGDPVPLGRDGSGVGGDDGDWELEGSHGSPEAGVSGAGAGAGSRFSSRLLSFRRRSGWLPPRIMRAVWSENRGFLLDRALHNPVSRGVCAFGEGVARCKLAREDLWRTWLACVCVCACTHMGCL